MKKIISEEKTYLPAVIIVCVLGILAAFAFGRTQAALNESTGTVRMGVILNGDESTAYSANFLQTITRMEDAYGGNLTTDIRRNVDPDDAEEVLGELAQGGCTLILANSYSYEETVKDAAALYPGVQFLQATGDNADEEPVLSNYHTFMGRIYEGRYVAGQVAGRKLQELINDGTIREDQALAGYVGAYPNPEVISGFTAFFLGMKEQCPAVQMRVLYTDSWSGYEREYRAAEQLIREGCVIISQHSDTEGPAEACEDLRQDYTVFHVGYNQNMSDTAPTTSLISTKIDWTDYLDTAVQAVLAGKKIESVTKAKTVGNDTQAGFDLGWVQMLALNAPAAAGGTQELIDTSVQGFIDGKISVFQGNYQGTDPENPADTIDLSDGYEENAQSSAPSFHYILDGITVEEME